MLGGRNIVAMGGVSDYEAHVLFRSGFTKSGADSLRRSHTLGCRLCPSLSQRAEFENYIRLYKR